MRKSGLADCLSRLPIPGNTDLGMIDQTVMVCQADTLAYTQHKHIQKHTTEDEELQCVRQQILQGWARYSQSRTAISTAILGTPRRTRHI